MTDRRRSGLAGVAMLNEHERAALDSTTQLLRLSIAWQAWRLPVALWGTLSGPAPAWDSPRLYFAWLGILAGGLVWPGARLAPTTSGPAIREWVLGCGLLLCFVAQLGDCWLEFTVASTDPATAWRLLARYAPLCGGPLLAWLLLRYRDRFLSLRPLVRGSWAARLLVAAALAAPLGALPPQLAAGQVAAVALLLACTPWTVGLAVTWICSLAVVKFMTEGGLTAGPVWEAIGHTALIYAALRLRCLPRNHAPVDQPDSTPLAQWRWSWVWIGPVLTLLLGVRLAHFQGVGRPIRVSGASMLPHWLGEHLSLTCQGCGRPFREDVSHGQRVFACPNCQAVVARPKGEPQPGDRVLVDRWPLFRPQRWQVVALRDAGDAQYWEMKRVSGLPGEVPGLVGGDIYANGKIAPKTLSEFLACAVLVHDDQFVSANADSPRRWNTEPDPQHAGRQWQVFPLPDLPTIGGASRADRPALGPIPVHPLRDLLLVCELALNGSGHLCWQYRGPAGEHIVELSFPGGGWTLASRTGGPSARIAGVARTRLPRAATWEFAVYDERLTLAAAGQTVLELAFPQRPHAPAAGLPGPRLAFGHDGLKVTTRARRVYRDLYYVNPAGTSYAWHFERPLASDEYFVLGDHATASRDSRQRGPVQRQNVLGRIVRWQEN